MGDVPVWTIVLAIIGMLVNIVIGLLIWAVSQKLADIKESIVGLVKADRDLAVQVGDLGKELAAHKLHVSEAYVRLELHNATAAAIFQTLRETKDEIVERVQELVRHVEDRVVSKMGGQQ
jgi:tetrahydromethanopterin S-methyltransferase subunit G